MARIVVFVLPVKDERRTLQQKRKGPHSKKGKGISEKVV